MAVADELNLPRSKLGTYIDSSTSHDYCHDRTKFTNYKPTQQEITTANGRIMTTIGMGDLQIELPNSSQKTKTIFEGAIHAPDMAFTLLSISRLDKAGFSVTFKKGMCTIRNSKRKMITTIPHSDGLYKLMAGKSSNKSSTANAASAKISISKAHRKLGHIAHLAIGHVITNELITGTDLDMNSKVEFHEACAKARSARQRNLKLEPKNLGNEYTGTCGVQHLSKASMEITTCQLELTT